MKQKDDWEKEFDGKFTTQLTEPMLGFFIMPETARQLKTFIRTLRQQAYDNGWIDGYEGEAAVKNISDAGDLGYQKGLAEALAAVGEVEEASHEFYEMHTIIAIEEKIQALMDGDDTENSVTIGIGEQKVKISIEEHHEEGSDKK